MYKGYNIYPSGYEMVSQCGLICISLLDNNIEHLFMYLLVICISIFEETSVQTLWPLFN